MSADQLAGWAMSALALGVIVGFTAHRWLAARRSARRHAAAELAFWVALAAFVDRARAEVDAPASETPIFDALVADVCAAAVADIDAEWRDLA